MKTATNKDRTPVANDVFTYCTKEKTETWHVVRNHDAKGLVDRVICKACGSEHKYKKEAAPVATSRSSTTLVRRPGASAAKSAAAAAASAMSSAMLEETWLKGLKAWGEKEVPVFSPDESFGAGQVFAHSVFGKGVVQGRRENKIDVLFKDGLKVLPSKKPA